MAEFKGAVLIGSKVCEYPRTDLVQPNFIVGRARSSSFRIGNFLVSKIHCIFKKTYGIWIVCDKSARGTYVNCKRLEKDEPSQIRDGDEISFGPGSTFKYKLYTKYITMIPAKRMRLDEYINSEGQKLQNKRQATKLKEKKCTAKLKKRHAQEETSLLQDGLQSGNVEEQHSQNLELEHQQDKERILSKKKLLKEKQLLKEKLKEIQNLLEEKDKGEKLLKKQLQEKEEQRLQDLKRLAEYERIQIRKKGKIKRLEEEKLKLENDIQSNLKLKEKLKKVKTDLCDAEGKNQCLQTELEKITKAKEDAESHLKDVLTNLGELVEAELECSICNELFVTATTLNCAHTFCWSCIVEWQKKDKTCPMCRTKITSQNKSIVIDNLRDRMAEKLSVEMKNQ